MNDLAAAMLALGEAGPWQRALRAQEAGDYTTAARLFASCAPDVGPGRAEVEFRIGWCLELAGHAASAVEHYERSAAEPADPALTIEALYRRAWIALERNEFERATPLLERAVQLADANALGNATVAHARYWHALCLEHDGRLIDAAARFGAIADEADPDLWHEAAYRRMVCLQGIGDFDGALATAERLIAAVAPVRNVARLADLREAARAEQAQITRARAAA